jgi:RNA recognition motif-containing protein
MQYQYQSLFKEPMGTCEVFVSCLPYHCNKKQLFDLFSEYYEVINVRIFREKMYGFVTLSNINDVANAVDSLDQHFFHGRRIKYLFFSLSFLLFNLPKTFPSASNRPIIEEERNVREVIAPM